MARDVLYGYIQFITKEEFTIAEETGRGDSGKDDVAIGEDAELLWLASMLSVHC